MKSAGLWKYGVEALNCESIFSYIDARHGNIETAFAETLSKLRPLKRNEPQTDIQIARQLMGVSDIITNQLACGFL
jgi:hypothetical protein